MIELVNKLRDVVSTLKKIKNGVIRSSIGELFIRYITLNIEQYSEQYGQVRDLPTRMNGACFEFCLLLSISMNTFSVKLFCFQDWTL